jgi:hypothetical protein
MTEQILTIDEFMDTQPVEITLFLTGKCNFNCDFCGYKDTYKFPDITKHDLITLKKSLIALLTKSNKTFYINLMGGEPTLNESLLIMCMNTLNEIRDLFPNKLRLWLTSNGWFGRNKESIKTIWDLSFDRYIISCSEDHFNQGNCTYIKNILTSDYSFELYYNIVNNVYDKYLSELTKLNVKEDFKLGKIYNSVNCINITDTNKLLQFYKDNKSIYNITYAPFGIFILNSQIYTACAGEGAFPWCKLSNTLTDLDKAIDKIEGAYLKVKQPCSKECMLTCRHLQKYGYTCFDKKSLEITATDKINIKEI